jgi:hypothetical protein
MTKRRDSERATRFRGEDMGLLHIQSATDSPLRQPRQHPAIWKKDGFKGAAFMFLENLHRLDYGTIIAP